MKLPILLLFLFAVSSCHTEEAADSISFPRVPGEPKLCFCESLGTNILFDTGAQYGTISTEGLRNLEKKGIRITKHIPDSLFTIFYLDNSSESFSEYYVADLQIGPRFVLKKQF